MARMVITSGGRHAYGASVTQSDTVTVLFAGQFALIENATDVVLRRGIRQGTRTTLVKAPHMAERQAVDAATFALLPNWLVQRCEVNRENGDYRDDMAQETIVRMYAKQYETALLARLDSASIATMRQFGPNPLAWEIADAAARREAQTNMNAWELCAWCDIDNPYYQEITRDAFRMVAYVTREYGKNGRADGMTHFQTHGGKVHADLAPMAQSVDALLGTVAEPVDEGDTGANSRAERMAWEIRRLLSPKQLEAVQLKAKGQPLTSTQRVQLKYARDKLGKLGILPPMAYKSSEPKPRIEREKYVASGESWQSRFSAAVRKATFTPQMTHA